MVEEMYQQESKEEETDQERDKNPSGSTTTATVHHSQPPAAASSKVPETSAAKTDPSIPSPVSQHSLPETPLPSNNYSRQPSSSGAAATPSTAAIASEAAPSIRASLNPGHFHQRIEVAGNADMAPAIINFGTTAGDVSLTLGLRHAGNIPEKNSFSVTEFGGC